MIETLIGSKLISVETDGFKVKTSDGKIKTFLFVEDAGDCCGFNVVETKLYLSQDELERNPVITNVEKIDTSGCECDSVKITLFGEYKPMVEIDSVSGSGSGWQYGACVTLRCIETNEEDLITSW